MKETLANTIDLSPTSVPISPSGVWVVTHGLDDDAPGRIGDAREIADRLGDGVDVNVLAFDTDSGGSTELYDRWIAYGADNVHVWSTPVGDQAVAVDTAQELWRDRPPRLLLTSADRIGRAWSARLAARWQCTLVSPALFVQVSRGQLVATALDSAGQRARRMELSETAPAIVALRPGVAQAPLHDGSRRGSVTISRRTVAEKRSASVDRVAADPATADIRHLSKLLAGGRGVGGARGFDQLRRVAAKIGAGVAATRMAVDLGWIEQGRQVGQTGKTVKPDLYIACGISGASHHLDGMSGSRCIVAINTDPDAPLLERAHLSIVGDLHSVLAHLELELEQTV